MYKSIKRIKGIAYLYIQESAWINGKVKTVNCRSLGRASDGDILRYAPQKQSGIGGIQKADHQFTQLNPTKQQGKLSPKEIYELQTPLQPFVFEGLDEITVKLLDFLEGKARVSRQFIEDLLRKPDFKEAEKQLIDFALASLEGKKISVPILADRIRLELLSLTPVELECSKWENYGLPDHRYNCHWRNRYQEIIYQPPFETPGGDEHFMGRNESARYFAHVRTEDIGDGVRRVFELQSDLFQRRNRRLPDDKPLTKKQQKEQEQLYPYRNIWHQRIIREEIRRAANDGMTELWFPTAETCALIEGFFDGDEREGAPIGCEAGETVAIYGEDHLVVDTHFDYVEAVETADIMHQTTWDQVKHDEIEHHAESMEEDPSSYDLSEGMSDQDIRQAAQQHFESLYSTVTEWARYMTEETGCEYIVIQGGDTNPDIIVLGEHGTLQTHEYGFESQYFDIDALADDHRRVVDFYEKDVAKVLRKEKPDTAFHTDDDNNTWFCVPIRPKGTIGGDDAGAVVAFKSQGRERPQSGRMHQAAEKKYHEKLTLGKRR